MKMTLIAFPSSSSISTRLLFPGKYEMHSECILGLNLIFYSFSSPLDLLESNQNQFQRQSLKPIDDPSQHADTIQAKLRYSADAL